VGLQTTLGLAQSCPPLLASGILQATMIPLAAAAHVHGGDGELHAEQVAPLADQLDLLLQVRTQAMVDVQGVQSKMLCLTKAGQQLEEGRRVSPSRKANENRLSPLNHAVMTQIIYEILLKLLRIHR
jgi:hypothetical protein